MESKLGYKFYAMLTIIIWGCSYTVNRISLEHFSVYRFAFLRYLFSGILLIIFACIARLKIPEKRDWFWFILAGASGFFLYMIFFNMGAKLVPSALTGMMLASTPVFSAIGAAIFYKEKLKLHQWAAIGISFFGILLIIIMEGVVALNIGLLYMLFAVIIFSIYNLIQRRLIKKYSSLQASVYSMLSGTVMLALFAGGSLNELMTTSFKHILCLLYMAVLAGAGAYVFWSRAFELAPKTSYVSNFMFLTPFIAVAVGFLIEGDIPSLWTIIGGIIIISGLIVFNHEAEPKSEKAGSFAGE